MRQALVIGNDSYHGNALHNARNDATAIAKVLESVGYRTTLVLDADRRTMRAAIETFSASITLGDLAFVYYAGHGLQVGGENYLVPVDFHISAEDDVSNQAYALSGLLENLTLHGATTQVVVLDACRDNPFAASRSVRSGWAGVISSAGSFLAFGTSPGSTADDDPGQGHGLFTQSLLKFIGSPLDVEQMFQQVRQDVILTSGGKQVPWTSSSLIGSLHINPQEDLQASAVLDHPEQELAAKPTQRGRSRAREANSRSTSMNNPPGKDEYALSDAVLQVRGFHFDVAIPILQRLLSLNPASSVALRLLGVALHFTGRSVEAMEALDRSISLNPSDALSYSYRCLVQMSANPKLGQRDCEQAVRLRDDLPEAHMGLAIILASQGKPSDAYKEASKAMSLNPAWPLGLKIQSSLLIRSTDDEQTEQVNVSRSGHSLDK